MKTRIGKIAQLPKPIRDDLNHRLANGQQSPELLKWLNALPETQKLLAEKFDHQPITKSNLSDWRHGGFEEWRQDQAREARIQRISETGDSLEQAETGDLFENFARIAVAELMADLDSLQKLRGEKRSNHLHQLIRDLARLQNAYNRSRWAELAWTKYNNTLPEEPEELTTHNSPLVNSSPTTSVVPDRAQSYAGDSHDSEPKPIPNPIQIIHHTKCECGEPCPQCHAPDSAYPLDEVLRDKQYKREHGRQPHDRHGNPKYLMNCDCDCPCNRCTSVAQAFQPAGSGDFPVPGSSPASNETHAINPNPQPPISPLSPIRPLSPIPPAQVADFSRRMALLKTASQ